MVKLVHSVGAPYARRLLSQGDFSDQLAEALAVKGFAFVEALELCPSYGIKFNPNRRLDELAAAAGFEIGLLQNEAKPEHVAETRPDLPSLFASEKPIVIRYRSDLKRRFAILISGSAGEGVQSAAEMLAQAAMACGLSVTKKGSYPVTVGVGFSAAEVILSPVPIRFTGITQADAVLVTSTDGLAKVRGPIEAMSQGTVHIDASLGAPATQATLVSRDYRTPAGARNASLLALMHFLKSDPIIPLAALLDVVRESKVGQKLDLEAMLQALN